MATRTRRGVLALLLSMLVACGLAACGAGSTKAAPLETAVYMVEVKQPYEGRVARDAADLDAIVEDAVRLTKDRESKMPKDAEETKLASKTNADFEQANETYANGSYEQAENLYRSIIDTYPLHYGANVNLTLALLHQQKNEEALLQALSCIELAPGEEGIFLNIQTAGVACGFSTKDLEVAMDHTLDELGRGTYGADGGYDEEFGPLYEYNKLWDRLETDLVAKDADVAEVEAEMSEEAAAVEAEEAAAAEAMAGDEAEAEAGDEASADAEAEGTDTADLVASSRNYDKLEGALTSLGDELTDDPDVAALRTYLYVVGLQLGFEADPTLIGPMHTMPYIAVDSDLCTIQINKISTFDDKWQLNFALTNKTKDKLSIGRGKAWLVNGEQVNPDLSPAVLEPGETTDLALGLTAHGDAAGKDATSFMGMFVITSQTQNTVLAAYPISWEAEAES